LGPSQTVISKTFVPAAGQSPGDTLVMGVQVPSVVSTTGRYPWSMQLTMNFPTAISRTLAGYSFVVSQDSSPFGSGWTVAGVDRLVNIPADTPNGYPAGH